MYTIIYYLRKKNTISAIVIIVRKKRSEFFHGKDWHNRKIDFKNNKEFWQKKIEKNIKRDILVNETLLKEGWKVLRFWGHDIKKNTDICLNIIENNIKELITNLPV